MTFFYEYFEIVCNTGNLLKPRSDFLAQVLLQYGELQHVSIVSTSPMGNLKPAALATDPRMPPQVRGDLNYPGGVWDRKEVINRMTHMMNHKTGIIFGERSPLLSVTAVCFQLHRHPEGLWGRSQH